MSIEVLVNGQIKLDETRTVNPFYWDADTSSWQETDLVKAGCSESEKEWIDENLTDANKDAYKAVFIAGREG